MFTPYRYEKKLTEKRNVKLRNISNPLKGKVTARVTLSALLFSTGLVLLMSKVLIPAVYIHADIEASAPVIKPIASNQSSNLAVVEDPEVRFTFDDLAEKAEDGIAHGSDSARVETSSEDAEDVPDYFYISIPSLDIEDALVEVNTENLDPREALGHYDGSCLPDEACNVFIFGHSSFRNSKNRYKEGDYSKIFSRLDELEYGDEFTIKYKDKEYRYLVDLTQVRDPEDVNPLEQPYPKSLGEHVGTVELFTCTPPGSTKYRLSVVGKLIN